MSRGAYLIQCRKDLANRLVVLTHPVDVFAVAMLIAATKRIAHMRIKRHARGIVPAEESGSSPILALHEVDGASRGLIVDLAHLSCKQFSTE